MSYDQKKKRKRPKAPKYLCERKDDVVKTFTTPNI